MYKVSLRKIRLGKGKAGNFVLRKRKPIRTRTVEISGIKYEDRLHPTKGWRRTRSVYA